MAKARHQVIDIARGIGILLIVAGHNPLVLQGKGETYRVIYSFHVPLFLFLSGLVMSYHRTLGQTIARKADSYLKPYVVTLCLASLLYVPSQRVAPLRYVGRVLYASGLTIPWQWAALWFLPWLWVVSVFALVCHAAMSLESRSTAARLWFLGAVLVLGYGVLRLLRDASSPKAFRLWGLPFSIDLLLIGAFFFLLGSLLKERLLVLRLRPLPAVLAGAVFAMLHAVGDYTMDLNLRRYDDLVITSVEALLGIGLVWAVSVAVMRVPPLANALSALGGASLMLLILHSCIQYAVFRHAEALGFSLLSRASAAFLAAVGGSYAIDALVRRIGVLARLFYPWPTTATTRGR